jgi:hypothetical protein
MLHTVITYFENQLVYTRIMCCTARAICGTCSLFTATCRMLCRPRFPAWEDHYRQHCRGCQNELQDHLGALGGLRQEHMVSLRDGPGAVPVYYMPPGVCHSSDAETVQGSSETADIYLHGLYYRHNRLGQTEACS